VKSKEPRRRFLNLVMLVALGVSYGAAAILGGWYIYPRKGLRRRRKIFLAPVSDLAEGRSRTYDLPAGGQALVTHTGREIVALSNICPHLGCKVHWEEDRKRFFCPCHGGVFDKAGIALEGPPAAEGKNLQNYPLERIGANLFVELEEIIQS
jgi:Rieske Fe-S protein